MNRVLRTLVGAYGALAFCACEAEVDVVESLELGAIAWNPVVASRDGGASALWRGRSVWVFGDSILSEAGSAASTWRNNTATSTADLDASDGLHPFEEALAERDGGVPPEFLPMTADEVAFEAEHGGPDCGDDCAGIALWAGSPVVDPTSDRLLVFYLKLIQRPGEFNLTVLGSSVAIWNDLREFAERPLVRDGSEPTLLFGADEPEVAAAALVDGGQLFAFFCANTGELGKRCLLGRVDPSMAQERNAWQFWSRQERWTADWRDAKGLFDGSGIMSVHYNAFVDRWLAVYSRPLSDEIVLRTSSELTGPWSDETVVHEALDFTDDGHTSYSALAHPEFARDGGRFEYLTYYEPHSGGMRLVELELSPD